MFNLPKITFSFKDNKVLVQEPPPDPGPLFMKHFREMFGNRVPKEYWAHLSLEDTVHILLTSVHDSLQGCLDVYVKDSIDEDSQDTLVRQWMVAPARDPEGAAKNALEDFFKHLVKSRHPLHVKDYDYISHWVKLQHNPQLVMEWMVLPEPNPSMDVTLETIKKVVATDYLKYGPTYLEITC
jgi:hypothetical protein